jgi:acyl carrier protein
MAPPTSDEAARRIADFIVSRLEYQGSVDDLLRPDPVKLTEAVDSAGLLELASFVEDSFDVTIPDDEIAPETFATVADLVLLLRRKGAVADA